MENEKILFSINNDHLWSKVLDNASGMLDFPDEVSKIGIIAMGTAILSLLKSSDLEEHKARIFELSDKGIDFYLCVNTMTKYGITKEMILPEIKIAEQGANMKILELKDKGFYVMTTDDI